MIITGRNGCRVLGDLTPWVAEDGGLKAGWEGTLFQALMSWDPETVTAVDLAREGDPMAMLEYGITCPEDMRRLTADHITSRPEEFLGTLLAGNWMRNTILLWRELVFCALTNGGDEWAVMIWHPKEQRLKAFEIITAGLYFAPQQPDGSYADPACDGYRYAAYKLMLLRIIGWLSTGRSPLDGSGVDEQADPFTTALQTCTHHAIIEYQELPLWERKGGHT